MTSKFFAGPEATGPSGTVTFSSWKDHKEGPEQKYFQNVRMVGGEDFLAKTQKR